MRILYVATDQVVPGATGGSVHVLEVARGLARRGHEVHVVVKETDGRPAHETAEDGVVWHRVRWSPPSRFFRFRARAAVARVAERVQPHAVIERYYNFGGEGIDEAHARAVPSLLEVNSPVVDHPGSLKALLDAVLLVRPMRRRREALCARAAAIVSPLVEIVPPAARARTVRVSWGANVDLFHPGRRSESLRRELGVPDGAVAVLFSGSFRPWHGVSVLEEAARRLSAREHLFFVFAGGGEIGRAKDFRGTRLGRVAYDRMPEIAASCDIGAAPYDTRRLAQLRLGFYWSPLKIFEYMASALPTVTVPRPPLDEIVRPGREGVHVPEADPLALAGALERLAGDAETRRRMGTAARERVVERYSWATHCAELDGVLARITGGAA